MGGSKMKTSAFMQGLEGQGIDTFIGVPDSTLQCFCDYLNTNISSDHHFVTVNEGAAVGLAAGCYVSSKKPACVYMQNSGIGNALNPIASLANQRVYDIPMLFVIGYRGEPGKKDEPQHKFQGEITLPLLDLLEINYSVLSETDTLTSFNQALKNIDKALSENKQYALVIKKGTFEKEPSEKFKNPFSLVREDAIRAILQHVKKDDVIVSTTGKISREVYEQCDALFGNHEQVFLTVGSMGHASMIALGIAKKMPNRRVICMDGDGAAFMHMGSMAFIANQNCPNFLHITLNNQAHESVGGMPTDCKNTQLYKIAEACGYPHTMQFTNSDEINTFFTSNQAMSGPAFMEILVSVASRADLGRPKESAVENKLNFMKFLEQKEEK